MKYLLPLLIVTLLFNGCSKDESEKSDMDVIPTTWADIQAKFLENQVTAEDFYNKHAVKLSGQITSINKSLGYAGSLFINDGSSESIMAAVDLSQSDKIKTLKSGQDVTVICYSVPLGLSANDCYIQ